MQKAVKKTLKDLIISLVLQTLFLLFGVLPRYTYYTSMYHICYDASCYCSTDGRVGAVSCGSTALNISISDDGTE